MGEFDRIIGYAGIKQELEQTADILRNLDAYKAAGAKTPSGMLIHGAPGLGKSLMAECLIEAAGLPAFTVRKDKADGAFVGFVKQTFDQAAASAPAIVYLNDMDKFANADEQHRNAGEYVAVQSCIDAVKGQDVFVLATTNDPSCLPDSLMRTGRFDRKVNVAVPEGEDADEIITRFLKGKPVSPELDRGDVALLMRGHTCAELEVVLNEALIASIARREKTIGRQSFMDAYFKICVHRPFDNARNERAELSGDERRRVAVHEAGHAVVYEVLASGSISLAAAFRQADTRGGLCHCYKPNGCSQRRWEEVRILGGLGGRAATEVVFGVTDEGATDDLNRVGNMIGRKIESGVEHGQPVMRIGRVDHSDSQKKRLDALVEAELSRSYMKAKEILTLNREFLDKMADAIAGNEYLTASDIRAIKRG